MTKPLAGLGSRMLGRSVLTLANVITAVARLPQTAMNRTFSTTTGPGMPVFMA